MERNKYAKPRQVYLVASFGVGWKINGRINHLADVRLVIELLYLHNETK